MDADTSKRKPERNSPCYCGSGKKFKKCCLTLWESYAPTGAIPEPQILVDEAVEVLRNKGMDLLQAGDIEAAKSICRQLHEQHPDYPDPLELEAAICEKTERWDEAVQVYGRLLRYSNPKICRLSAEMLDWYQEKIKECRENMTSKNSSPV